VCAEDNVGTKHVAVELCAPREVGDGETEVVQTYRRRSLESIRHARAWCLDPACLCECRSADLARRP